MPHMEPVCRVVLILCVNTRRLFVMIASARVRVESTAPADTAGTGVDWLYTRVACTSLDRAHAAPRPPQERGLFLASTAPRETQRGAGTGAVTYLLHASGPHPFRDHTSTTTATIRSDRFVAVAAGPRR